MSLHCQWGWRAAAIFSLFSLTSICAAEEYPVRTIWQGPPGSWLENLRVRSNGSILATRLDQPLLVEFDPSHPMSEPRIIHEFEGYIGITGITETEPDVFVVATSNFSLPTLTAAPGTGTVWTVDYRRLSNNESGSPSVSKLTDLPDSELPNGVTYQPSSRSLFITDSSLGVILAVDALTGEYDVALNDSFTNKISPTALEGCNGIKYFEKSLYWTNSGGGFFAQAAVHANGSVLAGSSGIVANPNAPFDDFAIARDRNGTVAYVAGLDPADKIYRIRPETGEYAIVVGAMNSSSSSSSSGNGESSPVVEPTSLAFGRTRLDREKGTIYITTGGTPGSPFNGSASIRGQLLAFDVQQQFF